MRLDHLLSKGRSKGWIAVWLLRAECVDARRKARGASSPEALGRSRHMRGRESMSVPKGSEWISGLHEAIDNRRKTSGGDALKGNTRSHPEHDG